MAFIALIFDPATGNCLGPHFYGAQPAELPTNEIACTAAQAQNAAAWKVSNGALVAVPPTLAQQAQALLDGGFQVQSTSTPAINGTYPCDPGTQAKLNGLWNILQKYSGGFPSGVSAIPVVDSAGAPVIFSSATVLENFLTEYAGFVLACDAIIATNAGTLPALPVTIA